MSPGSLKKREEETLKPVIFGKILESIFRIFIETGNTILTHTTEKLITFLLIKLLSLQSNTNDFQLVHDYI